MVGQPAPDFTLEGVKGREFTKVNLSDYRGKWVVLFFWPLDFTFVCPTEIKEFSKRIKDFESLNSVVLGCSVDSKYAHLAWIEDIGEQAIPMLSDITKDVSADYDVLVDEEGVALRGTFIIDPDGIVRYLSVNELSVGRSVAEILRVLEAVQTGELCPVEWAPGEATLGKG
jgi:alkyl hydroperoxide reductase subunit AhpC